MTTKLLNNDHTHFLTNYTTKKLKKNVDLIAIFLETGGVATYKIYNSRFVLIHVIKNNECA